MKRILSVFLTAVVLLLGLCSCSNKPDFAYGEYESKGTENTVYLKILSDGRAGFSYNKGVKAIKRASYTYDQKEETVTVQVLGNGGTIFLKIEDDKFVYVADKSSNIEEANGVPMLEDGLELYIAKAYPSS